MSDDDRPLGEKLQDVDNVGPATADDLLDIINAHAFEYPTYVEKAFEAAEAGDDRQAAIYLRRANRD